jgi:hypothetical protein
MGIGATKGSNRERDPRRTHAEPTSARRATGAGRGLSQSGRRARGRARRHEKGRLHRRGRLRRVESFARSVRVAHGRARPAGRRTGARRDCRDRAVGVEPFRSVRRRGRTAAPRREAAVRRNRRPGNERCRSRRLAGKAARAAHRARGGGRRARGRRRDARTPRAHAERTGAARGSGARRKASAASRLLAASHPGSRDHGALSLVSRLVDHGARGDQAQGLPGRARALGAAASGPGKRSLGWGRRARA